MWCDVVHDVLVHGSDDGACAGAWCECLLCACYVCDGCQGVGDVGGDIIVGGCMMGYL